MSGTPPASDPSMDDILASIRKILNEDDAPGAPAAPPPAPPAEEPLELTPDMMIAPPPAPAPAPAPQAAVMPEPEPAPMPAPPPPPAAAPAPPLATLVAPAAAAAAAAALGELSRAVTQDRTLPIARNAGVTLEDMVREELRPMLKAWLDEHLAPMVERIVRAEIERVMAQAR